MQLPNHSFAVLKCLNDLFVDKNWHKNLQIAMNLICKNMFSSFPISILKLVYSNKFSQHAPSHIPPWMTQITWADFQKWYVGDTTSYWLWRVRVYLLYALPIFLRQTYKITHWILIYHVNEKTNWIANYLNEWQISNKYSRFVLELLELRNKENDKDVLYFLPNFGGQEFNFCIWKVFLARTKQQRSGGVYIKFCFLMVVLGSLWSTPQAIFWDCNMCAIINILYTKDRKL